MGIVQSKKNMMTKSDLLTILDFTSSKYLLSSMYEEMTNLKDPKYCNNLVIITADLLDNNFTSSEIDYIYSKKMNDEDQDIVIGETIKISDNIKYNDKDTPSEPDEEEPQKEPEEPEPEEPQQDEEEPEEPQQDEEEPEEPQQDEEEPEEPKEDEEEEKEFKREKIYFGNKENLNVFSEEIKIKKKYKCIGIAKFYVKVAHIYAAIMTTINPIYKFRDDSGELQKIKMSELKDNKLPEEVTLEASGICDNRVKMLEENYAYLKKIEQQLKDGDSDKVTKEPPPHCKLREVNLLKQPGIPELERLYYDVYDFERGEFNDMSSDMKEIYLKDIKKFYKAFTGNEIVPDDNISKFSDINLNDYSSTNYCSNDSEYTINGNMSLLEKYASHIRQTLNKTQENHKNLIEILDILFGFTFDGEDIMIRPELTYEDLGKIVEASTKIIVNLYTECEKDFKVGIDIFEALIELKKIELMPVKDLATAEAAYVRMVG